MILIERQRELVEELHDRGAIEPRSRCDRAAIVPPSAWNRSGEFPTCSDGSRRSIHATIGARSWLDRGAIVADRGEKRGSIVGFWKLN